MAHIKNELVIEAQIKSLVHTILENCKKERDSNLLLVPLQDYEDRVAFYTGLQKESLDQLLGYKPIEVKSFDIVQCIVVMKTLLKFYKKCLYPKFLDIYQKVKHIFMDTDIAQFRRTLTSMGFDYRKTVSEIMIVENPELTFERFHYLKKIKKIRSLKMPISYLEERYIDKNYRFNKPDFNKDPEYSANNETHIGDGFYLYHLLSDAGLENYFITNKICKMEHKKWVFDMLLKSLSPCAIIIDNHPLHGEWEDDTITRYHKKVDMTSWLRKRNIPYDENMCKAELYELISRCNKPSKGYEFDRLLKANGCEVVRLPTGYDKMSPISAFWAEVVNSMPRVNTEITGVNLEEDVIRVIKEVHNTMWKEIKLKASYYEGILENLYYDTEKALENYVTFDVKNIDTHTQIPEYFYVLDNY